VTYQQLDWLTMESDLTLSAADSPAKTSALPEKAQDLPVSDQDSGGNITASSRKRSRRGSSRKTYQPFALADWTTYSGASLRSGMTRNGIVYPLQPLVPHTVEIESGSWATPTANPSNSCTLEAGLKEAARLHPQGRWTLWSQVAAQEVHQNRMWPTPAARDYKGANGYETTIKKLADGGRPHLDQFPNAVQLAEGRSIRGTLNPQWVEWLMGFPIGWTDLKHSGTR
jgi:hypothetical protein